MRLAEFEQKKVPYDIVEDIAVFMRNDSIEYHKHFFPAVMKMKDLFDNNTPIDANKCLGPAVDGAIERYCEKFNLGSPSVIISKDDRSALLSKLYAEELTQIKKGAY